VECTEVRELLSPASDREVSGEELRIVEEHLSNCKECAFQSTMIVGLKRLLHRWDGVHASERFRSDILDRVRKEPPPRRANWIPWALGGGLGGVCVIVLALAFALPVAPDGQEPPVDASLSTTDAAPPSVPTPEPAHATTLSTVAVAQFRTISKAVQTQRPGAMPALATVGDVVAPGSAVRCPDKGAARLALLAGLSMRLEGGAHVVFAEGDHDCELRAGRILLCTKDPAKRPRPYKVRSGSVTVELRDVEQALVASVDLLATGALRLIVAEGSAVVVYPGGRRTIGRGQVVEFAADGSLDEAPTNAKAEEIGKLRRWGRPWGRP
jgi:hypothetical protein